MRPLDLELPNPYDALAPENLPAMAGLELDYRTRNFTDREARHTTLSFFLGVAATGTLFAFGIRAAAEIMATWLFLAIVGLVASFLLIYLYLNGATRFQLIVWTLLCPVLWLLSLFTTVGLHGVLWLIAGAFAIYLSHAVTTHRALWMHAHPQLDRTTRVRWQSVWRGSTPWRAFRSLVSRPSNAPSSDPLVLAEKRELHHYYLAVAVIVVALLAATVLAMLIPGPFVNGIAGFGLYVVILLIFGAYQARALHPHASWVSVCRNVYDAWGAWFLYNVKNIIAPGVFQSPFGPSQRRFLMAYGTSLLLAVAVVPLCAYFPLPVLVYGNGPWVDAANRSWVFRDFIDATRQEFRRPSDIPLPEHVLKQIPESERPRFTQAHRSVEHREAPRRHTAVILHNYESYLVATLQGMSRGEPFFFVCMGVSVLACHAGVGIFLLATSFALSARRLLHHSRTLEGTASTPGEYHRTPRLSPWEAYVDRLRQSLFQAVDSNGRPVRECDHLFLGYNPVMDYPILLDRSILREHAHITGDTGSGKTALGIAPLVAQLIGQPDTSVVIIDLKGDSALFEAARLRAEEVHQLTKGQKHRLRFKWYTNHQGSHTFAFNPFLQGHFHELTIQQKASILLQSLGLDYGEGFGPSYYSAIHRDTLVKVLREDPRINSFRDLARYFAVDLRPHRKELNIEKRQHEEGTHLYTVVDLLAANHALNITAESAPNQEVLRQQIDMSAVVRQPHVVYFYLSAPLEESSARETAKLALHSLLTAAVHRGKSNHQVYVFVDEFQQVVSTNIEIVLRQARSHGISVILANQTISDLKKNENINLIPTVQGNTRLRQVFAASDVAAQELLSLASGEQSEYMMGFAWTAGRFTTSESHSLTEHYEPRIRREDIIHFSDRAQHSLVQITRGAGFTQYGGHLFPLFSEFHVSQAEYERRSEASWPGGRPGTYIPPRESDIRTTPPSKASTPHAAPAAATSSKESGQPPPSAPKDDLEDRLDKLFTDKETQE